MTTTTTPEVGMKVLWAETIHPNGRNFLDSLIRDYGEEEMIVLSAEESKGRWMVTMGRDGKPLFDLWQKAVSKPEGWLGDVLKLSWDYLRPA